MGDDKLQSQRFELKYLIREPLALSIRDFVQSYLEVDEFGATLPDLSYPVHSLYLDSSDLKLYHSTINGDKNRFKLRLRFYEDRPQDPVYFEIKRRVNNTISKQRGGVVREAVDALLAGQLPTPDQVISNSTKQHQALREFCHLVSKLQARPVAHIAYRREAWISPHDNSVRLTIDRDILCAPDPTSKLTTKMEQPVHVFGDFRVLELKFTNRYPDWFRELVRVYNLVQCGAAKYVDGATLLGTRRLQYPSHQTWLADFKQASAPPIQRQSHLARREQALNAVH